MLINSTDKTISGRHKNTDINCHLPNHDQGNTYFSNVSGTVTVEKDRCITECYSNCQICWNDVQCEPICSEDMPFTIEGFAPQGKECEGPFYFCNRRLTTFQYEANEISENGQMKKRTKVQQFIGNISI